MGITRIGRCLAACIFLIAAGTVGAPALANEACSRLELLQSESYYDDNGFPRGMVDPIPPKRCKRGELPEYPLCYTAKNIDLAAQFLDANGLVVRRSALLSQLVYEADTVFKQQARKVPLNVPFGGFVKMSDRDRRKGDPSLQIVSRLSIPPEDDIFFFWDRDSDIVVAISFHIVPSGRKNIYIGFRGTSELVKHFVGTNLPEMDATEPSTEMYNDANFVTALVRGAIKSRAGLTPETVVDPVARDAALQRSCDTSIIFTGHSLGGGLAIRAATATQLTGCNRKSDGLIVFNPATPSAFKYAFTLPSGGLPSLMAAAVFQNQWDPVKWAEAAIPAVGTVLLAVPGAAGVGIKLLALTTTGGANLLRQLEPHAQVIHFGGMRFGDLSLGEKHSMDEMADAIVTHVPQNSGSRLSAQTQLKLCDWYTPL
ncbi:MAG: lipase family protein [Pseudomonas sp.]